MPGWVTVIDYAERFKIEPHLVNPPLKWWLRLAAWDDARAKKAAREQVEAQGLDKVKPDVARLYNDLMITLKAPNG